MLPACSGLLVGLLLLVSACGLKIHEVDPATSTTGGSTGAAGTSTSQPAGSSSTAALTTTAEPPVSTGAGFLVDSDAGPSLPDCDVFAQDCPEGQKCVWISYYDSGENMGCVPLAPDPKQPGEPCVYETEPMYGWPSGVDDCDKGAMCFGDGTPGEGICVGLCKGSYGYPYCDEGYTCVGGRTHWYCQRDCDPLVQDCPMGYRCALGPQGYAFGCQIEYEAPQAGLGGPCTWEYECEPGQICTWSEAVPDCSEQNCCTKYCDLGDPAFDCGLDGQTCQAVEVERWVEWPEHVGICSLPGGP